MVEAKDLKKADISLTGKGKSDPYAIVTGEDSAGLVPG